MFFTIDSPKAGCLPGCELSGSQPGRSGQKNSFLVFRGNANARIAKFLPRIQSISPSPILPGREVLWARLMTLPPGSVNLRSIANSDLLNITLLAAADFIVCLKFTLGGGQGWALMSLDQLDLLVLLALRRWVRMVCSMGWEIIHRIELVTGG